MALLPAIMGTGIRVNGFRLGYRTPAQAFLRRTHARITLNEVAVRARPGSVTIRDILNDAPNTCDIDIYQESAPLTEQRLRITINSDAYRLLFAGAIQTAVESYEGKPTQRIFLCTAQDDTPRANRRIPLGYWEDTSATTVARWLVSTFAPGFTSTHVESGLPVVTVLFDGSEAGMNGCLRQLAKLIGGYFYWEDFDLHLFQTESSDAPDDIDTTPGRFLDSLAIKATRDDAQLRTRVYGKGHGEATLSEVPAGSSIIPIADVSTIEPVGQVISLEQILTYTGVQVGGGGALVGPGAAPANGPTLALGPGSGVETGVHAYAVTFVTASGESIPSPSVTIVLGQVAVPSSAPNPSSLSSGGSVDAGSHDYAVTFVTATGETTESPISAAVTTGGAAAAPPASAPTAGTPTSGGSVTAGAHYYAVTFTAASGESAAGPSSGTVTTTTDVAAPTSLVIGNYAAGNIEAGAHYYGVTYVTAIGETTPLVAGPDSQALHQCDVDVSLGPAGVLARKIYRSTIADAQLKLLATLNDNTTVRYHDDTPDGSLGALAPTVNTTGVRTVPLTSIPTGPAGTTARNLYRTAAGGSQLKLLTTIANNSTTTYSDTIADGSLGANAPSGATLNTVNLTGILTGSAAVISRKLYRRSGGAGLKLLTTIADNTTTTYTDTTANASLGAAVPTTNTATANQVTMTAIALGPAATTSRKVYRTAAGGSQLKLLTTIADNTTPTYTDSTADASLGANVPTSDTSLLAQPDGQVTAGSASLIVASAAAFSATGGWAIIGNGAQVIRYTAISGQTLTGIPGSGIGSITAAVAYNSTITAAPALTGVTGLNRPLIKGAPVNIWVQRNDVPAQVALAARDGSDGIVEHRIVDERRGEASLIALCDADLAQFSRPIVTVTYATRDMKTKSGKPITINIPSPDIDETLTIQDVTITEIDIAPGLAPKFTVSASSVRFSLEDLLRRMASTLEGL